MDEELLHSHARANWRDATQRTNKDYLETHIYPLLEHVALKDISKFQVQMLLNRLASDGYSYTVVYHVRDLIKAALAEAVEQDVLQKNVARKTVVPEIEEHEKPVLPIEMYSKLLGDLRDARDRAIFMIVCFCALRPSELFGLTWGCCQENVFMVVNTAWRGRLERKKIKRKNHYGGTNYRLVAIADAVRWAIEQWRSLAPDRKADSLMFLLLCARGRMAHVSPMHPDNFTPLFRCCGGAFLPTESRSHTRQICRPNSVTEIHEPR